MWPESLKREVLIALSVTIAIVCNLTALVAMHSCDDGHERISLTPKGEEAYKKLVQWINEVIHGRNPAR